MITSSQLMGLMITSSHTHSSCLRVFQTSFSLLSPPISWVVFIRAHINNKTLNVYNVHQCPPHVTEAKVQVNWGEE